MVGAGSRLFPFRVPRSVVSFYSRRLQRAMVFVSPEAYARFSLACVLFPLVPEVLAALLLPPYGLMLVVAPFASVQLVPVAFLSVRASQRRRSVEAELPFVSMLLYVLSHETVPSLRTAFEKIEGLGAGIFPAFDAESRALLRDLTYATGAEAATIEESFREHPSGIFREFVHGYLTALESGRDVHEFVKIESERFMGLLEDRWRAFSSMVSSTTEIAFIFLAVFPIGMQMIAGALLSGSASQLLLLSILALTGITGAILLWLDYAQPSIHDGKYPLSGVGAVTCLLGLSVVLYLLHLVGPAIAALLGLTASTAFVFLSHGFFDRLRAGEGEVVLMLHDLAEEARSGVSVPAALTHLKDGSARYPSLAGSIATFENLLSLGQPPRMAQRRVRHPSWLVRVSFGLLAVSIETGSGFEQLDRLSTSFNRIRDARKSIQSSVLPFAVLGAAVPVISLASYWFLSSMQGFSLLVPGLSLSSGSLSIGVSVIATSILTGFIVSKAYSFSFRSLIGVPPILLTALISLLLFGLA